MSDSRLIQIYAAADDVRTMAFDMLEERTCDPLVRVRQYANWIIVALDEAHEELSNGAV